MNWKDYSSLKSDSKVSFAKETVDGREAVSLVSKCWDASTGEAMPDSKKEYRLSELEHEKSRCDFEIARAKEQSDELAKDITDFKKV